MFFGVGTLCPKQSVTAMGSGRSAVVWLVRLHCTLFWLKVLSSKVYDGKLLGEWPFEGSKAWQG